MVLQNCLEFLFFLVTLTSFVEQPCLKNNPVLKSVRHVFCILKKKKKSPLWGCATVVPEDEDRQLLFIRAELGTLATAPGSLETRAASRRWAQLSWCPVGQDSLMGGAGAGWGQVAGWQSLLITRFPCNPSAGGRTRPLNVQASESRWQVLQV